MTTDSIFEEIWDMRWSVENGDMVDIFSVIIKLSVDGDGADHAAKVLVGMLGS